MATLSGRGPHLEAPWRAGSDGRTPLPAAVVKQSTTSGVVQHNSSQHKTVIRVNTLEDFFAANPYSRIDLLKIDCEGAEYEILFNLPPHLLARFERIAMETHPTEKWNTADMKNFLEQNGFSIIEEGEYLWARKEN